LLFSLFFSVYPGSATKGIDYGLYLAQASIISYLFIV